MKKIVIIPVFCESHLIKYQIPNIIDTINPDYIIYNEGMFPSGPESSTNVSDDFLSKYTLDGKRGFDYEDLKDIISEAQKKHKNVKIILNEMSFPKDMHEAPLCYYHACSNFEDLEIKIEEGDLIYPLEGDVFHHENSKLLIEKMSNDLDPDSGFRSNWIDFFETPYYTEKFTKSKPKRRKICIKFGTYNFYKNVLLNFQTQRYDMLRIANLNTYHYCCWRSGKFKQLKYDQLNRDSSYWINFEKGMKLITKSKYSKQDIAIRPSVSSGNDMHWATYIDIEHPKHIKNHPNYKQFV
jgi:hypothetical protein